MRDYLKILSSIAVALLTLAVLVSAGSGIYELASGGKYVSDIIVLTFGVSWGGFILFGIPGSILWFVFLKALSDVSIGPMSRHAISASMSVVASWLVVGSIFFGGGVKELTDAAALLVPVIPVAAFSLLWYWWLFQRSRHRKARLSDRMDH